jgi:hypothetical protein
MDFDTILGATKAASQNLYTALIPFAAIAALGLLMYEAYKVFQGNAATLGATLLRIGVAVVLLGNFQTWMDTATDAVQGLVQQVGGGTTSEDLMQSYGAVLKDPGAKDTSGGQSNNGGLAGWWKSLTNPQTAVGDAVMKAFLWLMGAIAYGLTWLMLLLQRFLMLLSIAGAPIFFGLWMLTGTRSIGLRYMMSVLGLALWPLGWAFGNIVTKQLLAAVAGSQGAWLLMAGGTFIVCAIWIVINALFWPLAISKAITSGGGHASSWIMQSTSPVMAGGQAAASVATVAASGGGGAGVMAASTAASLASRPDSSPKV